MSTAFSIRPGLIPEGMIICAIADIHGEAGLLAALHRKLDLYHAGWQGAYAEIYLGDYIDRGPKSREVIDRLVARAETRRCVFLRGNHESMMLEAISGEAPVRRWLRWGGLATLDSYDALPGGFAAMDDADLREVLRGKLPAAHIHFLMSLSTHVRFGNVTFSHAPLDPGPGGLNVHGHLQVDSVALQANQLAIDTGAFARGVLTCVALEDDRGDQFSVSRG